jgi:hypothetical protein
MADSNGLTGKVMCGYQGWFRTPDDGTSNGWFHYGGGRKFEPGACNIDLWPDVRELPPAARVQTPFKHPDGTTAEVYSSVNPAAIALHFKWMREYHIDGVFLQRFATDTKNARLRKSMDAVLDACRKAAQENDRCWTPMYDLSGLRPGNASVVIEDWKRLQADFNLTDAAKNPALLHHRGKPLVALWGLGFSDRAPMLDDWKELIRFFKNEAAPGGCTIMLGVPTFWRTLNRDTITDPALHELIASADVVSPWTVGRYNSPKDAASYVTKTVTPDLTWCQEKKLDYLPVAFPGFSWHNMLAGRGKSAPVNAIPRLSGRFLWSQYREYRKAGAQMLYVAMFDELDEGTAIFKTRSDPPSGPSLFVAEPDVPNDHYLWLTGMAGRALREKDLPSGDDLPTRTK